MALSVYLAGRYRWAAQVESVAKKIRGFRGVEIVSGWHGWKIPKWMRARQVNDLARDMDIKGVSRCDVFVLFKDAPSRSVELTGPETARGGRYVELGMALAWGKQVIIVGKFVEPHHALGVSVFEAAPEIIWFREIAEMLGFVEALGSGKEEWEYAVRKSQSSSRGRSIS